jgi:hypothetical protein
MRRQYAEPKLTRFGEFRELTQQSAGKTVPGFDMHSSFDPTNPQCNPNANPGTGLPGCS